METVTSIEEIQNIKNNKIIGKPDKWVGTSIIFKGVGNILYCSQDVNLLDCDIEFWGNNSILYLNGSRHDIKLKVSLRNNSVVYIGKDTYFNGKLVAFASEQKHIFIGDNSLLAYDIVMRTADPHLVYSIASHERINCSKSIYIGDSVWIGQHAFILKGTQIGSGSIIGAASVLANKTIPSNVSVAGNPATIITENIFWDERCVHDYEDRETAMVNYNASDEKIFERVDAERIPFSLLEEMFSMKVPSDEKLEMINKMANDKNRFYIDKMDCENKLIVGQINES